MDTHAVRFDPLGHDHSDGDGGSQANEKCERCENQPHTLSGYRLFIETIFLDERGCHFGSPIAIPPIWDIAALHAVQPFWNCFAFTSLATHFYFRLSLFIIRVCAYAHLRFSLIRQLRSANGFDGHAIAAPQMLKGVFAESLIVE